MLEELALSCGTPSMNVVMPGLPGLAPMPRNRALLSFRAAELGERRVGREDAGLADDVDAGVVDGVGGDGRHADRQLLLVFGFLLRGDGHRRQGHAHERIVRGLLCRCCLSGCGQPCQDGTNYEHWYNNSLHILILGL